MATLFLIIIYLTFISLGLPDGFLGLAWPLMQPQFGAALGSAGYISVVLAGSTVTASLLTGKMMARFGTGKITFFSVLLTASAMFGYFFSPGFIWLVLFAIPLGLGHGFIDTSLNSYVASHYESHHMSWLHSFWGVGAMIGPVIMSAIISATGTWRRSYLIIGLAQIVLATALALTLPFWDKVTASRQMANESDKEKRKELLARPQDEFDDSLPDKLSIWGATRIKGVKLAMSIFIFYSGVETSVGLWGGSYLIHIRGFKPAKAAIWISFYYASITIGRFLSGFLSLRISNRKLIRMGELIILAGVLVLLLPLPIDLSALAFVMIGFGCAPIIPCMIHETPTHFGRKHAPLIVGLQMSSIYAGIMTLPPLLGQIANKITLKPLPFFLLIYILIMLLSSERIAMMMRQRKVK